MTNAKTYLAVPYAEKDAAKALGARWEPSLKKWYVPAGKDLAPFAKWQIDAAAPQPIDTTSTASTKDSGAITRSTLPDFTPYNGDAPPWD